MANLREMFENPGSRYRGKPFWAWNGKLEADELQRQLRVFKRMGLGGGFMHSRVGLATDYLSEEWFRMIRACVEEAREQGLEAWLYDEDRWPSGAAGGLVTSDPGYRHRNLQMTVCPPEEAEEFEEEPLALFSAVVDGARATDVARLPEDWDGAVEPEDASVLAFHVVPDEPSSWYNDATYLDTMSYEAVQKFIDVTYEAYKREVGEDFGGVIPGVFTDEPHHGRVFGGTWREPRTELVIPWTDDLPQVFQERYGYDILDHLPELFLKVNGEGVSRARWHYHDCKTFLFTDAFARQIGEWCGENDLLFTGHVLAESSLVSQSRVGGSPMRFYEHMQAPGIDILTERRPEYSTAKQCASVQHQFGRRWMLSELYGCTGWDFPFEGHKYVGDWQAALGVNLRCQHLSWYTMSGQAKRDYPASIHYQSPWWERYPAVEDYFARVDAVLSEGEPVRRLLVVHPVESVWARASADWDEDAEVRRLEEDFRDLLYWLLQEHVDFDYGDEDIMARHGAVEAEGDARLSVAEACYETVLVPPLDTVRSSTLELLQTFREAGGRVIFCEPTADYVDAEESEAAAELAGECERVPFERTAVAEAVEPARALSIRGADGTEKPEVLYKLHRQGEELRLFVCNTDRENGTGPLTVEIEGEGNVQLWDAETGERYVVEAERSGGGVRFNAEMAPSGSRLFAVTPREEELPPRPQPAEVRSVELPEAEWTSELTDHNVLVLDRPEFRLRDGDWQGPREILKADAELREAIGLPSRAGRMVQPWAREKEDGPTAPIALRYRFRADGLPRGPLYLALENPQCFRITLNGHAVSVNAECGWWVDRAIRVLPLDDGALRHGENQLLLEGELTREVELELAYLLGEFSAEVEGTEARLSGPLSEVGFGDWTGQGLPFYSGSVAFRTRVWPELKLGERCFVEVPEFGGACVRVLVDGWEAGVIGWPPHEVEVTDLVKGKPEAELTVEVIAHRRNAFGPLHQTEKPEWVGPGSFVTGGDDWQEEYNLVACGCLQPPRLSIRRD
ncbi:MAG: glycosyl hydrolase [Planctomycetota bacterium]